MPDSNLRPSPSKRVHLQAVLALTALLVGTACVDSPQEPATQSDSPLASTFDGLSKEATSNGDNARGNEFGWAAVALAAGMTPSPLRVNNNNRAEVYDAFVHATTMNVPGVTDGLTTRTLIAWRKPANVLQVIMVSAPDNVSNVLHPASMGPINISSAPFRGAHAAYYERVDGSNVTSQWIGVSGNVKLTDGNISAQACESSLPITSGVVCARARFSVSFDVRLASLAPRATTPSPTADRGLRAAETTVNGLKLAVRCVQPSLTNRGCETTNTRSR